jgi:hypothetical protein
MVDVAEDDITTVVLNNVKFDMFKWFHPTKVDYVRDRLTFYGFKETTVSSVTCDEMLDIIALRPSISTNEPKIFISVEPKIILVAFTVIVELNSILILSYGKY